MTMRDPFEGAELIHVYTREQAIEDGVLVNVTDTAREAGFSVPVAVTRAVWTECVEWDQPTWQDESGRLWDVVWDAKCAAVRNPDVDRVAFEVLRVPNTPTARIARRVGLTLHCGPGDTADPVITIMTPNES